MKKIIFLTLSALLTLTMTAQFDRNQMPEPGPAREIQLGKYNTFKLKNGLTVIVVEDNKLPRVTMNLLVNRDAIFEGDKAGYVEIAGELMRRGTTNRPKEILDEEIDFMGANVSTSSTSINASGLSKYAETLMEIMADIAINPAFPESDFESIMLNSRSGVESEKDDPGSIMRRMRYAVMYGLDHPYGESMTEETLDNVTLADCKAYYETYFRPNISYLAVVGNVRTKDVKKWARKYFRNWKRGDVPQMSFPAPPLPEALSVAFSNRSASVQSQIVIGNTIDLKPGHPDVVRMRVANQILGGGSQGRLFQNLREDKAYTYGSYSSYNTDKLIGSFTASADVRNDVTDSAVTQILGEIERMRTEPVDAKTLQDVKNYLSGTFGMSLERPQTLARFALDIERYGLPKDYYSNYLKSLNDVTPEDVLQAAKTYMRPENGFVFVVGKDSEVGDNLRAFGEVRYFDQQGNPTERPSVAIPAGITAQSLIEKYLNTVGIANVGKMKDLSMEMKAELPQGQGTLNIVIKKKAGKEANMFMQELGMMGMTIQRQSFDGKRGQMVMQGQKQEIEGAELASMMIEAEFFPEASYAAAGYELSISGADRINGEVVYIVEVKKPDGTIISEYYNAESGLKIRSEQTMDTPQGEMTQATNFADYREVEGFMIPHRMIQNIGGMDIKMDATAIRVNSGVAASEFSAK
ncbi:MAG: insulinase family protein [Flavobacteriales bacterium]|nr:MAG: insulinase family protein [Flavobacteriales bacterium]